MKLVYTEKEILELSGSVADYLTVFVDNPIKDISVTEPVFASKCNKDTIPVPYMKLKLVAEFSDTPIYVWVPEGLKDYVRGLLIRGIHHEELKRKLK